MTRQPHELLDALPVGEARQALARCCGSSRWVAGMLARRPFSSTNALHAAADEVWRSLAREDLLEAFAGHPKIGDTSGEKSGDTSGDKPAAAAAAWSAEEQSRAAAGPAADAAELRALNEAYAARFGYIFIVCATGKTSAEILAGLRARLPNAPDVELGVAAAEQARITHLRLEKLAR